MAPLFAVVIAGVPARVYGAVASAIRERYPNTMVLRGKGARLHSSHLATFGANEIAALLAQASDAVFGLSGRPVGFCRLPHRDCAEKIKSNRNCGNVGGEFSCGRVKPENFILVYQEAIEKEEQNLLAAFYFSPGVIRLPREVYDRKEHTIGAILSGIQRTLNALRIVDDNLRSGAPSSLLPPRNFGQKELKKLLRKAMRGECDKNDFGRFRQAFFREKLYFLGRSNLSFKSAREHGRTGLSADISTALSHQYRAGCKYGPEFHWDVSPANGKDFDGSVRMEMKDGSVMNPRGRNFNLLANDLAR